MIEKFTVSRDEQFYHAFPDVALTPSGKLLCVFLECTHHVVRTHTCIMLSTSTDRGRTWSAKRPITEPLDGDPKSGSPFWNCPRIVLLPDERLVMTVERIAGEEEGNAGGEQSNWLWFSQDEGETWQGPHPTPVHGIVPDRLLELKHGAHAGRWILSAHTVLNAQDDPQHPHYTERCWISDDQGRIWQGPQTITSDPNLLLCEGNVLELPHGELICFLRENSGRGLDAFTALSADGGMTWTGPYPFPLPGCHRPVAGLLQSGKVLISHRFWQGGQSWTQNFFAALTDLESCRSKDRMNARTRILPLDFDRSLHSDTGYSGWVQFPDGEIYLVNYIVDDAPKGQIRGYALTEVDFTLDATTQATRLHER